MSIFSRKIVANILLLSINLILLTIISRVVLAGENTNAILEQSVYLYYYESDDKLLDVGESQLYTFAPIPGEDITIVSYGLDDTARTSISLFDGSGNLVATGTSNQITEKPEDTATDESPQSPFITAIQYTANSGGLYSFDVKNESGEEGLVRTMLFVGEPFNTDLTLIDELNPLLPSKAFMVAGDPNREWENELTGETIRGLRTEVDVLPIERIDRAPDVFLSYSTLSYLPDVSERLQPVTFERWFNEDEQEIYLVNIRPIPEQETEANRAILEDIDYQTYNSNNFFFFEYLFSVGNGSDPIALDRGAGACAGLADRVDCISGDPNFGREIPSSTDAIESDASVAETAQLTVQGEVITVTVDRNQTCTSFAGTTGNVVTITAVSGTLTTVCLPNQYIPVTGTLTTTGVTSISGTIGNQQNVCDGTPGDDIIACTTGDDWIEALAGDDAIFADAGNDDIFGGDGEDFIIAGSGDDTIDAGSGYDAVDGGAGNDTINLGVDGGISIGGTGADTFIIDDDHTNIDTSQISGGTDFTSTGDGEQDTFDFNGAPNGSIALYTDSADLLDFTDYSSGIIAYPDVILGSSLTVTVQDGGLPSNISGSAYDDTFFLASGCVIGSASGCISTPNYNIDANGGDDTINTNFGNDTIDAGSGNDTINSSSGNDTLTGGAGDDNIDGGLGIDTFEESGATTAMDIVLVGGAGTSTSTGQGNDTFTSIENINTGSGDDIFAINDPGNNIIDADGGDDEATISGGSGVIIVDRFGDIVDVTDSGGGIGTDQYNFVETVNISGSIGNDIIQVTDENDNTIDGNGGSDTVEVIKNTAVSGTITIIRSGVDVNVTGTGIGTDIYQAISTVNVTGGIVDDTFELTDENDNMITGGGGTDTVNVYSTAGAIDDETITIIRSGATGEGANVLVMSIISGSSGSGIGNDAYNDIDQVNVTAGDGDDTFEIFDGLDNILDGGAGDDTINYTSIADDLTIIFGASGTNTVTGTGIGTDILINIENINGGTGNDTFVIQDESNNELDGGGGTDEAFVIMENVYSGVITIIRNPANVVTVSGSGFGVDTYTNIEQVNVTSVSGTDIFRPNDFNDNDFDAGGGIDWIDYSTLTGAVSVNVNLNTGIATGDGNDTLIGFENISGSIGNDTLIGDSAANIIDGNSGADTIDGGGGDDTLIGNTGNDFIDGGSGTDTLDESNATTAMNVTLVNGNGSSTSIGQGNDTFTSIENINTGAGDDTFSITDINDNVINANGGNDIATVSGGSGTITITRTGGDVAVSDTGGGIGIDQYLNVEQVDVNGSGTDDTFVVDDANDNEFDGLAGDDTVSYAPLSTPITVTIVGNQATIAGTGIGADTLYNIENIFTGTGNDYFDISGTVDYGLNSNTGADTFFFNVNVDGALALETSDSAFLDFSTFTASGITIDLSSAVSQSVTGSLDITLTGTFTSISGTTLADSISGTTGADTIWTDDGDDTIFGDAGADILDGNAGVDTISGGAGNDTIDGGTGNDILDGGGDDDTITGGAGNDVIDGGSGIDVFDESSSVSDMTIVLDNTSGTSSSAGEGSDTLTGIENINTGSGNDNFTLSDSGVNIINAAGGTDTVTILNAEAVTIIRTGNDVSVTDASTTVGNDQYNSVEQVNISGTAGDDVFTIDDVFDNIIDGQGGTNEIDYSLVTAVINVNALSTGTTISSTGVGTDTLINIQNITTGDGDDIFVIEENGVNNIFDASNGTDTATYTASGTISATNNSSSVLIQISGSDTDQLDNFETINFVGSNADDTFIIQDANDNNIDGSNGNDIYDASFAGSSITVTISGTVTAAGLDVGTDTLVDIETIITGDSDDTFIINTDVGGTYFFNAGGDSTIGNAFQFTGGGSEVTTITITGSSTATEVLDFSQFTGGAIDINLSDTSQQNIATNLFITFNEFIDDVTGTANADTIEGNNLDNTIDGGAGDDTILYTAGDDMIDGGAGTDIVDYTGAPDSITATLTSSMITVEISGTSDTQTITNAEIISGTNSDDTIIISEAVSTTVNAGGGIDTVDYSGLTDAINIDLSTGIGNVSGTSASDDHTLNDVEDVIGSNFNDTIIGNASDNNLDGGQGDDFIQGNTGNDTIDGGSGTDTVSYKDSGSGVNVNLESGSSSGGDGNDSLTSLENVSGSAFDDNISGTSGANILYGGDGDDTIYGNDGDDDIYGEAGNDTLYGGSLNPISGTSDGSDLIFGGAGNDIIFGGNDNTNGSDASDTDDGIDGGAGDDTIFGGNDNTGGGSGDDGNDTIYGGEGDDTIYGGNDNTNTGSGNDGSDLIMDNSNLTDDNDVIYGGNDNTSGSGSAGIGTDTDADNIDVDEGSGGASERDTVTGDNQIDTNQSDNDGTGDDTITADTGGGGDNIDYGDDQ